MRFELQKNLLNRFYRYTHILTMAFAVVSIILPFLMILILEEASSRAIFWLMSVTTLIGLFITAFLLWHAKQYTNNLEYQVEDNILYIQEGVFTYQRKSIPLDRVTDIRMVQTLLMRWVGIWRIHVQTAGIGSAGPEGVLWGIESPKAVRQQLLTLRQAAVNREIVDPAA